MEKRDYYSCRTGKRSGKLDLNTFRRVFNNVYVSFLKKDYFDQYFGHCCVDQGFLSNGVLGSEERINSHFLLKLGSDKLWPIESNFETYTEDQLFDMIEFLYDHISVPSGGSEYHPWNGCGPHQYAEFNPIAARKEYLLEINEALKEYDVGYELSTNGEILRLIEAEYEDLINAEVLSDDAKVTEKIKDAIHKYRKARSGSDKRDAVKEVTDVLEYLRENLKISLEKKDESALFNIVNNFGIRHHNPNQKTDYDPVFLDWMFYTFLATIHLITKIGAKRPPDVI